MGKDKIEVANMRKDYKARRLEPKDIHKDPITQFDYWFQEAIKAGVREANAMTLASATADGKPSARIVLLKDFGKQGFVFYTNYESRKGQELIQNPQAALVFCWLELERQVRIEGRVKKITKKASRSYFHSRPKGSQIGAHASPQSQIISDRKLLENKVFDLEQKYANVDKIPLPNNWGGFTVIPEVIEFWQGRSSRLHDRIRYQKEKRKWKIDRLAP